MDREQLAGTIVWVVLLLACAAPFYLRDRARKRNRAGRCARCAEPLPWDDRFRVEGQLLCATCARRTHRRIRIAVYAMVGLGLACLLLGIGFAVRLRADGDSSWWFALLLMSGCGLGLLLLTWFALWSMKADNVQGVATEHAVLLLRLLGVDKIRWKKNTPFDGGA